MSGQIAALAMAAAQRLIGEALDEKRQRALIDEFFSGVKAGKVVVLEDAQSLARILLPNPKRPAAHPDEQETRKRPPGYPLANWTSGTVTFRVDPSSPGWAGGSRWR